MPAIVTPVELLGDLETVGSVRLQQREHDEADRAALGRGFRANLSPEFHVDIPQQVVLHSCRSQSHTETATGNALSRCAEHAGSDYQQRPSRRLLAAFFGRVIVAPSGCWLWTAAINGKGYGVFRASNAHRTTYQWFVGPIAHGLEIDHLCRVRRCVNPAHCEAVTGAENRRRAHPFTVGRCRRGHQLREVGLAHMGKAGRTCRECRRITQGRYVVRHGLPLGEILMAALARERMRTAMAMAAVRRERKAS